MVLRPGQIRPGQILTNAANKAKTVAQGVASQVINSPAAQKAQASTQATLNKIKNSPLANSPVGQAIQQHMQEQLARGEDPEEFVKELKAKAEQEIAKRRHIVSFLSDALNLVRAGDVRRRLRTEVVRPARTRQLNSRQACDRVTEILRTPFPFLTWAESHLGPLTIGLALQAEGGAGVGLGGVEGISGLRHHCVCHFLGGAVALGAVAEAEVAVQLSASGGLPANGNEVSLEVTGGGGYGATLGVTAAFKPIPRRPTWQDTRLFEYEFKGIAVSLGGGGGLDVGVSLGVTNSTVLIGTAS